ncbi:MAG: MFS transporter [Pirellulales bacterium]
MTSPATTKSSLLVLFLVVFIDLLGFGIVLPLLPIYADELLPPGQYSAATQGWVIGLLMASFSAMQFLFAPLWGRLSDSIGRRPVLLIGLAGSAVCYLGFGIATEQRSLFWIFVTRIGAGMAGATISTAQAYIADSTTPDRRAAGMALIGAAFGLGFTFGPLIGLLGFVDLPATLSAFAGGEFAVRMVAEVNQLSPRVGYLGAVLSGGALLLAIFKLPESLSRGTSLSGEAPQRQWINFASLQDALAVPSILLLLLTSFVAVFSFANFESTLSLLLTETAVEPSAAEGSAAEGLAISGESHHDVGRVFLMFAYVGLILSLAQGFLVRRLAKVLPEGTLATAGAVISLLGFGLLAWYSDAGGGPLLMAALAIVVVGFAFLQPSLQSLISRRSDPRQQGGILGLGQSVSALARIVGPVVGIRLFKSEAAYPYWTAMGLMLLAVVLVGVATRSGRDYGTAEE